MPGPRLVSWLHLAPAHSSGHRARVTGLVPAHRVTMSQLRRVEGTWGTSPVRHLNFSLTHFPQHLPAHHTTESGHWSRVSHEGREGNVLM